MIKTCLNCEITISKTSKQWANQKYCSTKCRKHSHRRSLSIARRSDKRRANLHQNDETLYLVRQCKRAGTVQILKDLNLTTFIEMMDLIRNRPYGAINLCHIAPVKGKNFIGLLHPKNLFYGGAYQNNKFGKRYVGGGRSISHDDLLSDWMVSETTSTNEVLILIEKFLDPIISLYISQRPVRKSRKVKICNQIAELDHTISLDDLMACSHTQLSKILSTLTKIPAHIFRKSRESKYIAYMDSLSRFIRYGKREKSLTSIRKTLAIGYLALFEIKESHTYNREFFVRYGDLATKKYSSAKLKHPNQWPEFKDLMYNTAFRALQGEKICFKTFRRTLRSYLSS